MPRYLSGRTKRKSQSALTDERYRYLDVSETEPNLGDPVVPGDSPPFGQQYQIVSVEGYPGERYWIPVGGGIIPGSISIFDEGSLVGGLSSTTQINFVGTAISAIGIGGVNPGIAVTVSFVPPGNNTEILFKNSGDFASSSKLTFDVSNGLLRGGDQIQVGAGGTVITATTSGLVGIGTTNPTQELHIQGDIRLTGTIYDYLNDPGIDGDIIAKNSLGGVIWIGQQSLRTGAGGTYTNVQYHNAAGLVDGAPNFVFDDITNRVGIGSTQPQFLLDVLGQTRITGDTRIVGHTTVTGNFYVSGISTFTSFIDANGGAYIDNIRIGITNDNEIDTSSGDLTLDSNSGFTVIDDNLRVSGILTAQGNVDLGSSAANTVSFIADVDTNIIPSVSLTQNLGASDARWNLYVNNIFGNENSSFTLGNLNVLGISTLGSDSSDTLDINARVRTDIVPNQNITYDLGSPTLRWDSIYADELYANLFVGIANTALTLKTESNNASTTNYLTFVDSNNGSTAYENLYTSANIKYVPSTGSLEFNNLSLLGNANIVGILTVGGNVILGNNVNSDNVTFNSKISSNILPALNGVLPSTGYTLGSLSFQWLSVYALDFYGRFIGNADTASVLQNSRNIAITGDLSWNVNFDGSTNVTATGTLANTGVTAGTYGNSTTVPVLTVDSKGRITSASSVGVNFAAATVLNSERISTGTTTGTSNYYLTFVDSNNAPATYEAVYTDNEITYNPSTNILSASKVSIGSSLLSNGDSYLGNDINDIIVFNGLVDSNFIPDDDATYNLGSASLKWNQLYVNTVNASSFNGTATQTDKLKTSQGSNNAPYYLTYVPDANDITGAYEDVFTDLDLYYNPNSNLLNVPNATLSANLIVNGNTTLGDTNTDTVTINASIGSSIIPTGTRDLGSSSNRWSTVYANTFNGTFVGNADTATKLATQRNIAITGDLSWNVNFDGSANVTAVGILTNTGVTAGTYGNSTTVPVLTVDSKGRITSASTIGVNFSAATVLNSDRVSTGTTTGTSNYYLTFVDSNNAPATYEAVYTDNEITYNPNTNTLTTSNISITGNTTLGDTNTDTVSFNSRVSTSIVPSTNGNLDLGSSSNRWSTVYANTFNGAITGNVTGNADTASRVATGTTTGTSDYYLTFVDSNNAPATYEAVYTDINITYNPNTDLLTVSKIKPSVIQDSNSSTGQLNYVLTSSAGGSIVWAPASTPSGVNAIGGITVQDDSVQVGNTLGITTVNFVNSTVTQSPTGTVSVTPNLAAIGGISGITVLDDGALRGSAGLVTSINFTSNLTVTQNSSSSVTVEASLSSVIPVDDTSTSSYIYPTFVNDSGSSQSLKIAKTRFKFQPSTGEIAAKRFRLLKDDGSVGDAYIQFNNVESIQFFAGASAGTEVFRVNANSPNVTGGRRIFSSDGPFSIETSGNQLRLDTNGASTIYLNTPGGVINLDAGASGSVRSQSIYDNSFGSANTRAVYVKSDSLQYQLGYTSSSIRYKRLVENLEKEYSENLIYNSRPVTFNPIDEDENVRCLGFIAEEIFDLDPKLVYKDNEDIPCGLEYPLFTVHLVKVAQEQKKTIDELQSKLEAIEARLSALESN